MADGYEIEIALLEQLVGPLKGPNCANSESTIWWDCYPHNMHIVHGPLSRDAFNVLYADRNLSRGTVNNWDDWSYASKQTGVAGNLTFAELVEKLNDPHFRKQHLLPPLETGDDHQR